ncbi:hypothetical protein [Streptomyces sp. NPDC058674]|uniref:hypothetical protein n=1 Tax=Streptomyces sp. NPDC058674 TaxID=3346592 RepID=UPI00365B4FCB
MSTPEEQQRRQQAQQAQQPQQPQDPYGTQTWQSETWDTGYQPVHEPQPPHGGDPDRPVAPEGWFRDEAPAPDGAYAQPYPGPADPMQQEPFEQADPAPRQFQQFQQPQQPQQAQQAQQPPQAYGGTGVPDGWFREEAPSVAAWPQGDGAVGPAAETAYLPPYREEAPAEATAYLPPYQDHDPSRAPDRPAAPEGWYREEPPAAPARAQDWSQAGADPSAPWDRSEAGAGSPAPAAQAPVQDWSRGGSGAAWAEESAAEQTAYLPPQAPHAPEAARSAPGEPAVEQTAYLPPYPGPEAAPARGPAHAAPAPETAGEEPAYSPPTLAGNTVRAVDPAQARAEGRSPIIDPGPQPALLTAALGVLLAVAAVLGQYALLVPLIVLQGLTAAGWFRLNGMWPARQGIALAFAGALVADAAVLAVAEPYGPGAIVGTLGAWVLLTLVLQLRSHADPDERMYGLMASVASAALAVVCAGYLAADPAAATVGAAAVAVAVFARALPLPTAPSVGVALAAAAGAGIAVGGLTPVGAGGALIGLAAGVCALVGLRVAAYDYPSKFVHMTAGVALPLAAAAPAVYLMGRVVG